jgi:DnaJ-class molecular chaperone
MIKHVIFPILVLSTFARDFYEVLDIDIEADDATIKKAFRKLSRKHHPDKNLGDEENEKIYYEIVKAYDTLSD